MTPSGRALGLLAGWLALAVAASFEPSWVALWGGLGAGLAAVAGVDALAVRRRPAAVVERQLPASVSVGVWTRVRLIVHNPHRGPLSLELYDHHPAAARVRGLPIRTVVPPHGRAECAYRLRPVERGDQRFGPVELRTTSPVGLWRRQLRCAADQAVRVYPNFRASVGYELLAAENRVGALGIRRHRRRGEGLEFHQLREYRAGDTLRQIDWKATARLQRTISREYQDERDQQIVFLLDCGRRLHARDGERSHFDAALDAILLAAHVALRQGDAVGLMTFAGERRWLAPRKGVAQVNALLNSVYDLNTGARAADYTAAARDLVRAVRKRALVVLVSNVRDEDAEELRASLRLLSRRHLVLLASLREAALGEALGQPVEDLDTALRAVSIRRYLAQRRAALRSLAHSGALLLDSEPDGLPVAMVNRYLDIKAAGRAVSEHRAGIVALLGPPNAGKSTLLNAILGQKLAIVTARPQTTRSRILGIHSLPGAQIAFVDTPGLHQSGKLLNTLLNEAVEETARDSDLALVLIDRTKAWTPAHGALVDALRAAGTPAMLVGTKLDVQHGAGAGWPPTRADEFVDCRSVSARTGEGLPELLDAVVARLPESPPLYPPDEWTDRPVRWLAAELVREALFEELELELPYGMAVEVVEFDESRPELVRIRANLLVVRGSQKRIVVGTGGRQIKRIGVRARRQIEALLGARVHLELWVKVDAGWARKKQRIQQLGYG